MTEQTVVETKAAPPAVQQQMPKGLEDADSDDILIPRLLLQQGMSKFVKADKAKMGDICDSVSGLVVASKENPLRIIPLKTFKDVTIMKKVGGKYEFVRVEDYHPRDKNLPWDFQEDGAEMKRYVTLNYYVLDADRLEEVDAMPLLLSFRSTSYNTGKILISHWKQCEKARLSPWVKSFELSCHKEEKGGNTYYVFDVGSGEAVDPESQQVADGWYDTIVSGKHQVDDSDLTPDENASGGSEPEGGQY